MMKSVMKGQRKEYNKTYECEMCKGKCFVSKSYLLAHYKRRHPEIENPHIAIHSLGGDRSNKSPITKHDRIKELREIKEQLKMLLDRNPVLNEPSNKSKEVAELTREVKELNDQKNRIERELSNRKTINVNREIETPIEHRPIRKTYTTSKFTDSRAFSSESKIIEEHAHRRTSRVLRDKQYTDQRSRSEMSL